MPHCECSHACSRCLGNQIFSRFFKVENNFLELTRIFKESFKDQRWAWEKSVRAEKRDRDAERERKKPFHRPHNPRHSLPFLRLFSVKRLGGGQLTRSWFSQKHRHHHMCTRSQKTHVCGQLSSTTTCGSTLPNSLCEFNTCTNEAFSSCLFLEHGRHLGISMTSMTASQSSGNLRDRVFSVYLGFAPNPNPFLAKAEIPMRSQVNSKRECSKMMTLLSSHNTCFLRVSMQSWARWFTSCLHIRSVPTPPCSRWVLPLRSSQRYQKQLPLPHVAQYRKSTTWTAWCAFGALKMALLVEKGEESLYDSPGSYLEYSDRTDRSKMWTKGSTLELQARDNAYKAMTESPPPVKDTELCATLGSKTLNRNAHPTSKASSQDPSFHRAFFVAVVVALLLSLLAAILAGVALTKNTNETTVAAVAPTKQTLLDTGTKGKRQFLFFFNWSFVFVLGTWKLIDRFSSLVMICEIKNVSVRTVAKPIRLNRSRTADQSDFLPKT